MDERVDSQSEYDENGPPDATGGLRASLAALPGLLPDGRTTLGQLLGGLGDHQAALVLLVFSLPAIIPTPGLPAGMIFGTALALLSLQLVAGSPHFSLPDRLSRIHVSRTLITRMAAGGEHMLSRYGRWLKPRVHGLTRAVRSLGLVVFLMAVLIALPIPFGNVLPGLSVFFIALGLAERDGAAIGLGLVLAVLSVLFSALMLLGGWWLISQWFYG
jgi:Uncharacterized ABC-type transport system, permease components